MRFETEVEQMDREPGPARRLPCGSPTHKGEDAMLILSRKLNERIVIAGNITITVVEIRGDKIRLGIEAPNSVPVHREEVYQHIQEHGPQRKTA